jgi:colanic acid biosynthesis glycosyl transferase WcaI
LYVWHPPLTVGVSAWVISTLKHVPYVYDVQDLWPESALASGLMKPGRLVDLLFRLADWVYARAPRIFVVSDEARDYLVSRGVNGSKIGVAPHWIDAAPFLAGSGRRDVRKELGTAGKFVVMFAGNLGMVQGLEIVVEAATILRGDETVQFVLVGDGSDRPRLESMVGDRGLTNVTFAGAFPAADMPDFFRAADALLVHVRASTVAEHAIPTKTLAYLASGRPILCGMRGAGARVVQDAGAGLVFDPGNARALAAAVRQLRDSTAAERDATGERGRDYFLEHFSRDRIIDFYERELAMLVTTAGS